VARQCHRPEILAKKCREILRFFCGEAFREASFSFLKAGSDSDREFFCSSKSKKNSCASRRAFKNEKLLTEFF